jgi:Domain of unknown function (DUF4112)
LSNTIIRPGSVRPRNDALDPEVLPPRMDPGGMNPGVDPRIADVEALARWLDYAFALPGGFRFGLAGIIGLVPGFGDVFDAVVSFYIVARAIQLNVSRAAVARMLVNIGIEALAGSVPFVGDLFDVAFKANRRNYLLLKGHMERPRRRSVTDLLFLLGTIVLVVASVGLPVLGLIVLARHL